jgi:tetratricopeptide (TPR) repeat protein
MVDALKRYTPREPAEADSTVLSPAERDLLSASTIRALATVRNASGETFSGAAQQRLVLVYKAWVLSATKRPLTSAALASYEARFRRFDPAFVRMWQTEMARLDVGSAQVTLMILALGFQNDLWNGAAWRGGPSQIIDRVRSLPVEAVAGFAEAAGLSSGRRFVAANSLLGVDILFSGSRFQGSLFDSALPVARRMLGSAEPQASVADTAVAAARAPTAPSAPSTPPPVTEGAEGATIGQVIEAAVRSESAGDWPTALRHYENLQQLDPSIRTFVDAAIARVKTQLAESAADAFRRARLYDAIGRRLDAIVWYERAVRSLPDSDPNKKTAADRLLELRGDR